MISNLWIIFFQFLYYNLVMNRHLFKDHSRSAHSDTDWIADSLKSSWPPLSPSQTLRSVYAGGPKTFWETSFSFLGESGCKSTANFWTDQILHAFFCIFFVTAWKSIMAFWKVKGEKWNAKGERRFCAKSSTRIRVYIRNARTCMCTINKKNSKP